MMSILEARKLQDLIDRVETLEAEVAAMKSQVIASEAALELGAPQRRPGRPRKVVVEAQQSG